MSCPTRSANDPPPVKEAVGKNGYLMAAILQVASLNTPYRPTSWMRPTNGKTDFYSYIYTMLDF